MRPPLPTKKLRGRWHLVRTRPAGGKAQWLFFKAKDEVANAAYNARVQLSAAGFYKTPKLHWDRAKAQAMVESALAGMANPPDVINAANDGMALGVLEVLKERNLIGKVALIGVGTLTDENVLKSMGDEAVGVITSLIYSSVLDTPANKKFSAAYEKRFSSTLTSHGVQAYTVIGVLKDALERAGSTDRDKLRELGYNVDWHEYPMQHSVCMEEVADISAWLRSTLR